MIVLNVIQILSAIAGFVTFVMRRSRVRLIGNAIAMLLAPIGILGSAKVWTLFALLHAGATTGILGAFFAYQILLALFQEDRDYEDKEYHQDEKMIILLYSIPYLVDFIIGLIGLKWCVLLIEPDGPPQRNTDMVVNHADE